MGEKLSDGRIDRRELLKRGAVAGGIVWASPMVFSAVAGAQVGACTDCPSTRLFGIKANVNGAIEDLPTSTSGAGNCLTATASAPPSCFTQYYSLSGKNTTTHVWTLQPALQLCQAAAKVGDGTTTVPNGCFRCSAGTCPTEQGSITIEIDPVTKVTTVTITDAALSHSEILFCYRGSPNSCVGSL